MKERIYTVGIVVFFVAFVALGLLLLGSLVPIAGGYQIRLVESGSMEPTIPVGSAIVVKPKALYQIGDIVTYQRHEDTKATTHRIVSIDENNAFIMQGDANNTPDLRKVQSQEIVGGVYLSIPYLGYILDFLRKPIGFVLLIGIPALFILVEQIQNICSAVRAVKAQKKENS
jgi:signal peptidase